MQQFRVRYYNGKSSRVFDAVLALMRNHWEIIYTDTDGREVSARWELSRIVVDPNFTNLFIFRYGDFPEETLESNEADLGKALKEAYPDKPFFKSNILNAPVQNGLIIAGLIIGALGLIVASYLYILPFAAEKMAGVVPVNVEKQIGDALYENIIDEYDTRDTLSKALTDFAAEINIDTNYVIRVTAVRNSEMNAFALPGGHIVVYDQMLSRMKNKEELAALLGHEMAHIHYRHSLKSLFRSLGAYLFVSLLLNDINGIAAVLADNSNMLLNLTYSRELETEADARAVAVMEQKGIRVSGFVSLFELLKENAEAVAPLKILSTHPLTDDRIAYAKGKAAKQKLLTEQPGLERQWQRIRAGM